MFGCTTITGGGAQPLVTNYINSFYFRNGPMLYQSVAHLSSSTFDTMYNKMINLEGVHYMEDTLAQLHDYTGYLVILVHLKVIYLDRYLII